MYVAFFFEAIFIGYSMGTAPIVSYNYGARRDDELQSIFRKSLTVIACAGLFLTISAYFAAPMLANIFVGYDETFSHAHRPGVPILFLFFPPERLLHVRLGVFLRH